MRGLSSTPRLPAEQHEAQPACSWSCLLPTIQAMQSPLHLQQHASRQPVGSKQCMWGMIRHLAELQAAERADSRRPNQTHILPFFPTFSDSLHVGQCLLAN